MTTHSRPDNHEQRTDCNDAVLLLLKRMKPCGKGLPEPVTTTLQQIFLPARDKYLGAYASVLAAAAIQTTALREVKEADKVFDSKGRAWNKSVTDIGGKSVPQQIEQVMGVLPGKLFTLRYGREVLLASKLFDQLPNLPHLRGEPWRLAEFVAAHAGLSEKVKAVDDAKRVLRNNRRTLEKATRAFDRKWTALVKVLQESDPALAQDILPAFPSTRKSKKAPIPSVSEVPPEVPPGELPVEAAPVEVAAEVVPEVVPAPSS